MRHVRDYFSLANTAGMWGFWQLSDKPESQSTDLQLCYPTWLHDPWPDYVWCRERLLREAVSYHNSMSRHSVRWVGLQSVTAFLWENLPARSGGAHWHDPTTGVLTANGVVRSTCPNNVRLMVRPALYAGGKKACLKEKKSWSISTVEDTETFLLIWLTVKMSRTQT